MLNPTFPLISSNKLRYIYRKIKKKKMNFISQIPEKNFFIQVTSHFHTHSHTHIIENTHLSRSRSFKCAFAPNNRAQTQTMQMWTTCKITRNQLMQCWILYFDLDLITQKFHLKFSFTYIVPTPQIGQSLNKLKEYFQ